MPAATRVVTYYALPGGVRDASQRLAELSRATAAFARARHLVVLEPFVEVPRDRARPELARALARCREAHAALLVPSLAAIGSDLLFLEALLAAKVALLAADAGAASRPTLALLRDVARHTQAAASTRSRDALHEARRRGVKLGSPRPEIGSRAEEIAPVLRELLLSNPGASLRDLAALLDRLEVPTPRRGRWGPSAVRNALRRAGLG